MQLLKRAANGNYAFLLETTIEQYLVGLEKLHTVRGRLQVFISAKSLCAFYGVFVPSSNPNLDEADWIKDLRTNKREHLANRTNFSDLHLIAFMSGAIDYMLETKESERGFERFNKLYLDRQVIEAAADFLQMWTAGYIQQKERFEHS